MATLPVLLVLCAAGPHTYAVVVGSNAPGSGQGALKYAEADAQHFSEVLVQLGHHDPAHLKLLMQLVRYGARGPIAESRLSRRDDGRYAYETKRGVTLVLSAEQLLKRLIALIPPRGLHLTNFFGVLAAHSAERPRVMARPAEKQSAPRSPVPKLEQKRPRIDWATLLARTWEH